MWPGLQDSLLTIGQSKIDSMEFGDHYFREEGASSSFPEDTQEPCGENGGVKEQRLMNDILVFGSGQLQ